MFFGNVASYQSFNDYFDAVRNYDDNKVDEDLLHQIFVASKICNQKFKNQKQGIVASSIEMMIIVIWLILGYIVYYV